jgi:DNA-binding response OmpR family regulator
VGSGKEAATAAKENKPALVILDLVLPGEDGFGVLEEIKGDPILKDIPVIILSNLGQKEEVEKGMSLGAEEFMIKVNFTPDEIVEKIRKILQTKYV